MSLFSAGTVHADTSAQPVWIEGEDFASVSGDPAHALSIKPPASNGTSTAGAILAKAGSEILYRVDLPKSIEDAKLILRYARLHFRDAMQPVGLNLSVTNNGQTTMAILTCGDTRGWGTNDASEWQFAEVPLATTLREGKTELRLSTKEDNSNLNIDGFFLAPADFSITSDELRRLQRVHITSEGYVGLEIPGDTVFPGAFDGFALVGRGFGEGSAHLQLAIKDSNGTLHSLGNERTLTLSGHPDVLHVDASVLDGFSDGDYELQVDIRSSETNLRHPLTIMRDLIARARDEARHIRETVAHFRSASQRRDEVQPAEWKLIPDLEHAAEYIENTILLLEARQRGESTSSERAAALAYFEKSKTRTAQDFARDFENVMAQTARALELAKDNRDPYEDRFGDLRRAFFSKSTGALEPYRIFIPEAYAELDSIPLILMLHGGGGDENYFPDIEGGVVREILDNRPHIMLSPKSTSWYRGPGVADLKQLVDATLETYPKINRNRIYCTGVSAGGGGTFNMAMEYPDLFRAIACVSSGPRITDKVERLNGLPILLVNGQMDVVVPAERARRAAAELEKRGHPHKLVIFPDYGHEYHGEEYLNLTLDFFERHL